MPVNYSGNVQKIIGNRVTFKVSNLKIYNILLNHGTFIKVSQMPGVFLPGWLIITCRRKPLICYDVELPNVMMDQSKKYMLGGARAFPDKNSENYQVNFLVQKQKELLVQLKALCDSKLSLI